MDPTAWEAIDIFGTLSRSKVLVFPILCSETFAVMFTNFCRDVHKLLPWCLQTFAVILVGHRSKKPRQIRIIMFTIFFTLEKKKKNPLRSFSLRRYAVTRYAVNRFTNNPLSSNTTNIYSSFGTFHRHWIEINRQVLYWTLLALYYNISAITAKNVGATVHLVAVFWLSRNSLIGI